MKIWKATIFTLLCFAMSSFTAEKHEYYVTVGELDVNPETHQLEIALRIFTDDLEYALEKAGNPGIDVLNDDHAANLVSNYIKAHFKIYDARGELLAYEHLGSEGDGDAVSIFLESGTVATKQVLRVQNDILMDVYADQLNILHVRSGESLLAYRFDRDNKMQSIQI